MGFEGSYSTTSPPSRGGLFINYEVSSLPRSRDVSRGVAAVAFTSDWGPSESIVEIQTEAQATAVFGDGGTGLFTIVQALEGEGIAGRDGASVVLAYRLVGAAGAEAVKALVNTAGSPVTGLTLTAIYDGARGNDFKVTVRENPDSATMNDIILYEGTTTLETYTDLKANIQEFADAINAASNYVTATVQVDNVALAEVTSSSFASGNSGETLLAADHTAAQEAFESYGGFDTFAVDNLPDDTSSIRTSYVTWAERLNSEGKLFHMVIGGPASETAGAAVTRAIALDSKYVVAIWGDVTIDSTSYSSARMASRVAGLISSASFTRSISGSQIFGASLASPPGSTQLETLVAGGVVPFYSDGGLVRLQRAKTTYQSTGVTDPNVGLFDSLTFMRRLHHTFNRFGTLVSERITGQTITNTPTGRDSILAIFTGELKNLEEAGIVIPGARVIYDPSEIQTGETLYLLLAYRPAPSIEQILGRVSIATG